MVFRHGAEAPPGEATWLGSVDEGGTELRGSTAEIVDHLAALHGRRLGAPPDGMLPIWELDTVIAILDHGGVSLPCCCG